MVRHNNRLKDLVAHNLGPEEQRLLGLQAIIPCQAVNNLEEEQRLKQIFHLELQEVT